MADCLAKTVLMHEVKKCINEWLLGHAHVIYDMQKLVDGWVAMKEEKNEDVMKVLKYFQERGSAAQLEWFEVRLVYMNEKMEEVPDEFFQGFYFPETDELVESFERCCNYRIELLREFIHEREKLISFWHAFDLKNDTFLKAYAEVFAFGTLSEVMDFENSCLHTLPYPINAFDIEYVDDAPCAQDEPSIDSLMDCVERMRRNPENFDSMSETERNSVTLFDNFLRKVTLRNKGFKNAVVFTEGLDYWNVMLDQCDGDLVYAMNGPLTPIIWMCAASVLGHPTMVGTNRMFSLVNDSMSQILLFDFPAITDETEELSSTTPVVNDEHEENETVERVHGTSGVLTECLEAGVVVRNIQGTNEKEKVSSKTVSPQNVPNMEQVEECIERDQGTAKVLTASYDEDVFVPNIEKTTEKGEFSDTANPQESVAVDEKPEEVSQSSAVVSKKQMKKIEKEKKKRALEEKARKNQEDWDAIEASLKLNEQERNAAQKDKVETDESEALANSDTTTENCSPEDVAYQNSFKNYLVSSLKMPDSFLSSLASKFVDLRIQALNEATYEDVGKDESILDKKNFYLKLREKEADSWTKGVQLQLCMLNSKHKDQDFCAMETIFCGNNKIFKDDQYDKFENDYKTAKLECSFDEMVKKYADSDKMQKNDSIAKAFAFLIKRLEQLEKELGKNDNIANNKHKLYEKVLEKMDGPDVEAYIVFSMCVLSSHVGNPSFPSLETVFMNNLQERFGKENH